MKKRLFAIGDIHGCFGQFQELVEEQIQLRKEDKLILLGDYIDRGLQSKEVIDYIISLQNEGFDIVALTGNHEVMLLDAFEDEGNILLWLLNGGGRTLKSFGVESIKSLAPKYLRFFKSLPFYYAFGNYLFVHAGFNDGATDPFQDRYSMVWESSLSYSHPLLSGKTIIHAHRPIPLGYCFRQIEDNCKVINIDTGCVYKDSADYGVLTAIELTSKKLFSV